ncbi:ketoacyl reductase [Gemmatimonadetes bacterium T265]|nr:ketoacyl reductase [Gemmatimonadetes bacterium T265]
MRATTRPSNAVLWLTAAGAALWTARTLARRARRIDFRGRVALVTGGSRGLGLEIARQLVGAGARVAICARDEVALSRALADLVHRAADRGGRADDVLALPCDVTVEEDVRALVAAVEQRLGPVDLLVNDAGTIEVGPSEQMTRADFDDAMATNFYGALHTVLAVTPGMRARRSGRVVNIASIGGKISVPHLLPYSASKFALVGLSEGLRASLLKDGVFVTTVCPGEIRTGSAAHAVFKGEQAAEYRWFTSSSSAPVAGMAADEAARRVVDAAAHGDAELIMPTSAWLGVKTHGLLPGLTADLSALAERGLPAPAAGGTARRAGHEVDERLPAWARAVQDRAVAAYNQGERFAP